jgi:hypothetical protein
MLILSTLPGLLGITTKVNPFLNNFATLRESEPCNLSCPEVRLGFPKFRSARGSGAFHRQTVSAEYNGLKS